MAAASESTIPASAMSGDVAIAAAGSAVEGRGFVGVWAKDAAGCAQIGTATSGFAVITNSTFRDGPSACYGNLGALTDGKGTFQMSCSGTARTVQVAQASPDTLTLDGVAMTRCKP